MDPSGSGSIADGSVLHPLRCPALLQSTVGAFVKVLGSALGSR